MKILLEIEDDKVPFFLEVLKNFSFVKAKPFTTETPLLKEIELAVQNLNLAKHGKLKPKPLSELLDKL